MLKLLLEFYIYIYFKIAVQTIFSLYLLREELLYFLILQ